MLLPEAERGRTDPLAARPTDIGVTTWKCQVCYRQMPGNLAVPGLMGDRNGVKEVTYFNTYLPREDLNICLLLRTFGLAYRSLGKLEHQCQINFLHGITPQRK